MTSATNAVDEPQPGDVVTVSGDRIATSDRSRRAGSTVVVNFRRHAMWGRIVQVVPGPGYQVRIIGDTGEPPSETAGDPGSRLGRGWWQRARSQRAQRRSAAATAA